jgi:hypothetical protein
LPGYSSFAPVLAGWIGAPAPKGSKARAPATYNIYRRPCVHFFLVPTWNLRERQVLSILLQSSENLQYIAPV